MADHVLATAGVGAALGAIASAPAAPRDHREYILAGAAFGALEFGLAALLARVGVADAVTIGAAGGAVVGLTNAAATGSAELGVASFLVEGTALGVAAHFNRPG